MEAKSHRQLNSFIIVAMAIIIVYNMMRLDQGLTHLKELQVIALELAELKDKTVCQEMLYSDIVGERNADQFGPRI